MKKLNSNQIRKLWLNFFESRGHYVYKSESLIPINDDSLLWINSGVSTLKKYFDGSETPPNRRITNCQKSIRTNDIENVGITTRHHTFFEMLGNFSIGDYFKEQAIHFAWELLTSKKYFDIDKNLLYITVFEDDKLAIETWIKVGVDSSKIYKMGKKTNFWDMGKGPCGPSSEIFFDKGEKYDSRNAIELISNDIENDRFIEIWNIVFSEMNNDGNNNYTNLPQKNIDTGAGLERIASVLQNKPTNFETDLFENIIKKIDSKTKFNYLWEYIPQKLKNENPEQFKINSYFKGIADFIRSVSFAIADGALPEANGRGYVLRRLIRRSVLFKNKLNIKENFLYELVDPLIKTMGEVYVNIADKRDIIISTIKIEEEQFNKTLNLSLEMLNNLINEKKLNEENVFYLHETYGLPLEILKEMIEKDSRLNLLNWNKIEEINNKFKLKTKINSKFGNAMEIQDDKFIGINPTIFLGYELLETISKVIFIENEFIVFDKTPFYATSGGQESDFGKANEFNVVYVKKNSSKVFIHQIPFHNFNVGDEIKLVVDFDRRNKLTKNHSATHLLFSAIEEIMKVKVPQHGSKVEDSYLRFDFAIQSKINDEDLLKIQKLSNDWIKNATNVEIILTSLNEAKKMNASYLEGTKYSNEVRVVKINDKVIDMCGGTHVKNTSEIEKILITKFEKKGSGIFRIEAITGINEINNFLILKNIELISEKIKPMINKLELINNKLIELNLEIENKLINKLKLIDKNNLNLKNEINEFDLEFKKIQNEKGNLISKKIKELILNKNNKISILEFEKLMIGDLTKNSLEIINSNNDINLIIGVIKNLDKSSIAFIINKKLLSNELGNKLKEISIKNSLNGSGNKQLYVFGGKYENIISLLNEVKKWEF